MARDRIQGLATVTNVVVEGWNWHKQLADGTSWPEASTRERTCNYVCWINSRFLEENVRVAVSSLFRLLMLHVESMRAACKAFWQWRVKRGCLD